MAKLGAGMADKLKNMARGLKEEDESRGGIKKVSDSIKNRSQGNRKTSTDGGKVSGRKN